MASLVIPLGALDAGTASAVSPGPGLRQALVIVVNWDASSAAGEAHGGDPLVVGQAAAKNRDVFQAMSNGQFPGWNVTTIPSVIHITAPRMGPINACENQGYLDISDRANQAALDAGFDPSQFSNVVYSFPYACGIGGRGDLGPGGQHRVWLTSTDSNSIESIFPHELGHNLGLNHGHSIACVDTSGKNVPVSGNCTTTEYGDIYNRMGSSVSYPFSAIQLDDLGWIRVQDASVGEEFDVESVESNASGLPQALRFNTPNGILWAEYRSSIGVTGEVLIHREAPDGPVSRGSYLVDMNPDTPHLFDAGILPGEARQDPLDNMTISVVSAGAKSVHIKITQALQIGLVSDTFTKVNVAQSLQLSATGGAPPYIWSATGLPPGMSLNSSTGLISGTPTTTGVFSVAYTLGDVSGAGTTRFFTWTVSPEEVRFFTGTATSSKPTTAGSLALSRAQDKATAAGFPLSGCSESDSTLDQDEFGNWVASYTLRCTR